MRLTVGLALLWSLAACTVTGGWTRVGTDPQTAADDLADCNSLAQHEMQRDANIDTDIEASRSPDWSKFDTLPTRRAAFDNPTHDSERDISDRCMIAKGYAPTR
jgi:hypothetical protein